MATSDMDLKKLAERLGPEPPLTPGRGRGPRGGRGASRLAERCRLEFIDLTSFQPDQELFRSVPVELMFRYNFLPYKKENGKLIVVTPDPTNVPVLDELARC